MPRKLRCAAAPVAIFLLVLLGLVHACSGTDAAWAQTAKQKSAGTAAPKPAPVIRYGTDDLPEPVREMREAILPAVRSGKM